MLLWESHQNGNHYVLKKAGGSRRLYRNRVFHSQCHLSRIANGGVWDMLWLPCFMQYQPQSKHKKPKRILLLGVGLGASLVKLRTFMPGALITAVDIDPVHLQLAKSLIKENASFLKRKQAFKQLTFVCGDAIAWLQSYCGPPFDIIVDDLFIDGRGATGASKVSADPCRVIALNQFPKAGQENKKANKSWLSLLHSNLNQSAVLIANCESARAVTEGYQAWARFSKCNRGAALRTEHYENRVAFFLKDAAVKGAIVSKGSVVIEPEVKGRVDDVSFDRAGWLESSNKAILESDWAEQCQKSPSVLRRELGKLFDGIKIRKYV